mmetsp:Transcript_16156/g.43050  ORF Transcript_16156/g.43050 Transcript_16156/m.43050 type:complete len:146 (-) Transcript_16156:78-515(-)
MPTPLELRSPSRSESLPALISPSGSRSPGSPGLRSTGASVMKMQAGGRGPRDQCNQLTKFHYEQMEKKASGFVQAGKSEDARHVRTTVGSSIFRPGQKAENMFGCSITSTAKLSQELSSSRAASKNSSAGAGTQTLHSPTSGLLG